MSNQLTATENIAEPTLARLDATRDRIEAMLEQQQAVMQRDYARAGLVLGGSMVGAGSALMIAGIPFAFSVTCLAWGPIVVCLALLVRHRGRRRQVEQTRLLCELHERSTRLAQRTEILGRMWSDGLPPNCSVGDVLVLLDAQVG